jgi:hypothetical protein
VLDEIEQREQANVKAERDPIDKDERVLVNDENETGVTIIF